jgi:hydrogenase maturation protease
LLSEALAGQDAEVLTCHQLTPELAERLSRCRFAVFIDAEAGGDPGTINRRTVHPEAAASPSSHGCTASRLLADAEELYGRCPQAVIITVSAQSFEYGETLSPAVAAALPKVIELVSREIQS